MAEELTAAQKAKPTDLQALIDFATRTKAKIAAAAADATAAIKKVTVSDGTINFFTDKNGSGTADFSVDFPKELVLDQIKTKFEPNFKFADGSYGDTSNPSLDGKPVLVVAVKGSEKGKAETTAYSFIDFSALVDTYSAKAGDSAKILDISGYEIEVKISAETGNLIEVKNDGLFVGLPSNVLTTASIATTAEVKTALDAVFGAEDEGE